MGERFKVMVLSRGGFPWASELVSRSLVESLEAPA
jgi:hypothetical protein